ncbi:MAG: hypothetical protein IH988_10885 [Planctomycetes bacterium]|nr:hypothetical protein [Planctomycetota bacterium]
MSGRIQHLLLSLTGAFVAAAEPNVLAGWPDDPAVNLAIADRPGEQVQPKIRVTTDGGAYVSWFDNATGGYDVYLQRLDSAGNELWVHNGVLLANRGYSSTQDYDLDIDTSGNALVTFRDDRSGSSQITATRVSPDGVQMWGATGVQLTAGSGFFAAPKIAGTTDGGIVVAWSSDSDVALQKLSAGGNPVWGGGVTIPAIGGDSTSAADLDASDAGGVIISMVRGFLGPNHLHAQKLSSTGTAQWGETPLAVYDGGALQIANFPQFVPDGSGRAVFVWYSVSSGLQCHAQRILADGTEQFGHNGVEVSVSPVDRTMPAISFNPATDETFVVWREEFGVQFGVYAQKLSADGSRQWTNSGRVIAPLSGTELVHVGQIQLADGAIAFWVETLSFGNQRVHAARVDTDGEYVWASETVNVSSVASSNSRLIGAPVDDDGAILIWSDGRNDANDVYGQNINSDGTLGVAPACDGDANGDGVVDPLDSGFVLARFGIRLGSLRMPGGRGRSRLRFG